VNQPAKDVDAFNVPDNGQRGHRRHRRRLRNTKIDTAVRPGGVVVLQIGGQDAMEMLTVPDQHPVQTLGPDGAHPVGLEN
jgi:hypothetical protein